MQTPSFSKRLDSQFYGEHIHKLARNMLGTAIVSKCRRATLAGVIVEVEAYLSANDEASHSARGKTMSNSSMFKDPGTLYVYPIHSRHCLNVVCDENGLGAAVLVRAIEPIAGFEQMFRNRGINAPGRVDLNNKRMLGQGPGRLCESLGIDRRHDGLDLMKDGRVWLAPMSELERKWKLRTSPRIGISKAKELKYRYFIDGNQFVSGLTRDHSRGRYWSFVE